jgi:hypothetical protein
MCAGNISRPRPRSKVRRGEHIAVLYARGARSPRSRPESGSRPRAGSTPINHSTESRFTKMKIEHCRFCGVELDPKQYPRSRLGIGGAIVRDATRARRPSMLRSGRPVGPRRPSGKEEKEKPMNDRSPVPTRPATCGGCGSTYQQSMAFAGRPESARCPRCRFEARVALEQRKRDIEKLRAAG